MDSNGNPITSSVKVGDNVKLEVSTGSCADDGVVSFVVKEKGTDPAFLAELFKLTPFGAPFAVGEYVAEELI